ncbi:DUF7117 family protein [Natrononativus amylolyticus]|uniref:DUF7117 family protein n=1 Tax=Natrononativus amylolyticus TaxID=2963434 RepID=UPI0020CCE5D3|nr:TFIIB-type zinc ribbon-containing protein [Natrononativus amylolyticus]
MKIRGERECTECGTRWSYYETGSVGCPACGSLRSVGLDERTEHTDTAAALDLTPVRNEVDSASTRELATRARQRCREYIRKRGFISGGELRDLDDAYLAAMELSHVADVVARVSRLGDPGELYFLSLLADADGGVRPAGEDVPRSFHGPRGLAYASAVDEYRDDLRTWIADRSTTPTERSLLESLGDHVRRIQLLDGDVEPGTAERLVDATRDLANGLRGDDDALVRAGDRLERLE